MKILSKIKIILLIVIFIVSVIDSKTNNIFITPKTNNYIIGDDVIIFPYENLRRRARIRREIVSNRIRQSSTRSSTRDNISNQNLNADLTLFYDGCSQSDFENYVIQKRGFPCSCENKDEGKEKSLSCQVHQDGGVFMGRQITGNDNDKNQDRSPPTSLSFDCHPVPFTRSFFYWTYSGTDQVQLIPKQPNELYSVKVVKELLHPHGQIKIGYNTDKCLAIMGDFTTNVFKPVGKLKVIVDQCRALSDHQAFVQVFLSSVENQTTKSESPFAICIKKYFSEPANRPPRYWCLIRKKSIIKIIKAKNLNMLKNSINFHWTYTEQGELVKKEKDGTNRYLNVKFDYGVSGLFDNNYTNRLHLSKHREIWSFGHVFVQNQHNQAVFLRSLGNQTQISAEPDNKNQNQNRNKDPNLVNYHSVSITKNLLNSEQQIEIGHNTGNCIAVQGNFTNKFRPIIPPSLVLVAEKCNVDSDNQKFSLVQLSDNYNNPYFAICLKKYHDGPKTAENWAKRFWCLSSRFPKSGYIKIGKAKNLEKILSSQVWQWTYNEYGELINKIGGGQYLHINANNKIRLARKSDREIWDFGWNYVESVFLKISF